MEEYKTILDDFAQRKTEPGEAIQRLTQLLKSHPVIAPQVRAHLDSLRDARKLALPDYAKLDVELLQLEKQVKASMDKPIALAERVSWRAPEAWLAGWESEATLQPYPDMVLKKSFRLQSRLASNTYGETWEALDLLQDGRKPAERHVAILFLGQELSRYPQAVKNFITQFDYFQKRTNPYLAKVFATGREGGSVFIVTELVSGERLDLLIDKNPAGIPDAEIEIILTGLASAMQDCQNAKGPALIVNPSHIYYDPLQKTLKILDSGMDWLLAQIAQESPSSTVDSLYRASVPYLSCEVLLNLGAPQARDYVYALGCIAYELLAGRHPFGRKTCAVASENHYVPNAIKKLSNKQWQALTAALAFTREQRLAEPRLLIAALYPGQKSIKPLVLAGVAAAVSILALAAWLWSDQWQMGQLRMAVLQQDGQAMTTLQSWPGGKQESFLRKDSGALALAITEFHLQKDGHEAITQLSVYPEPTRVLIFREEAVQNRLKAYYTELLDKAVQQDRFAEATTLLDTFAKVYPRALDLESRKRMIQESRQTRLQNLAAEYRACMDNDSLPLSSRTPCLAEALQGIRRIEPQHLLLEDATLAKKYQEAITAFLHEENGLDSANTLLADWATLLPGVNPERDSLSWLAARYGLLENLLRDNQFSQAQAQVEEALATYPNDPRLQAYASQITKNREQRIKELEKKYRAYREQGILLPDENKEDVFDLRAMIQEIDSENKLLRDASLHKMYFDKVVELSAKEDDSLAKVRKLLEVWRVLFTDPRYFQAEDQEQIQRAENRVALRYLARSHELLAQGQARTALEYAEFALGLKPMDSVRNKLQQAADDARAKAAAPAQ